MTAAGAATSAPWPGAARVLGWARDGAGASAARSPETFRAISLILLIHLCSRMWAGAYPEVPDRPDLGIALALSSSVALGLACWRSTQGLGLAVAFVGLLVLLALTFPYTSNHFILEIWCVGMLLLVDPDDEDQRELAIVGIRWAVALLLFHSGLQKVMLGTYFDGRYLATEIAIKDHFADLFAWMIPAEEMTRLRGLHPGRVGAGPFAVDAPLFLVASNVVYVFEMAAPLFLLWSRTRAWTTLAVIGFVAAIQLGAREFYFGGLLVAVVLLYWPRPIHARLLALFALVYAALALLALVAPGVAFY